MKAKKPDFSRGVPSWWEEKYRSKPDYERFGRKR
jgi:hypothetical protein